MGKGDHLPAAAGPPLFFEDLRQRQAGLFVDQIGDPRYHRVLQQVKGKHRQQQENRRQSRSSFHVFFSPF